MDIKVKVYSGMNKVQYYDFNTIGMNRLKQDFTMEEIMSSDVSILINSVNVGYLDIEKFTDEIYFSSNQ